MYTRITLSDRILYNSIPRETLNTILCHLVKRKIMASKNGLPVFRPHFRLVTLQHSFKMKNHVILVHPQGIAWCLLKTQYAKKPKNPV